MFVRKLFLLICAFQSLCAVPLTEQFKKTGFVEICVEDHETAAFDALYASFDELIAFLQANPVWAQKLYSAKERFIRSKERNEYSTDFFGFYDESLTAGRNQVSFYYSTHFHAFISARYPDLIRIPAIVHFFETCHEIQKPYGRIFKETATELGIESIFSEPPILFKVVKYLPSYVPTKPHYDGSAFSLFLDSTDNQSLLLAPYQSSYAVDDFATPQRNYFPSILLIPGTLLAEFSIYPTPHIVAQSGSIRYATIAFAMRPHFKAKKIELTPLPNFY